jgi:hypothetical protein
MDSTMRRQRHRLVQRDAPFHQSSGQIAMARSGIRNRALRMIMWSDWFHIVLCPRLTHSCMRALPLR